MSSKSPALTDSLYTYLLSITPPPSDILVRLREETQKMPQAECQIAAEQGPFMALLVQLLGVRKALEIGVFTGYSALTVALALPEDGRLIACDISDEWTQIGRRYWKEAGVEGKIDLRIAPALQTLDTLLSHGEAGTFDFAFIDADKVSYDSYYERVLQLLRPGGLLLLDNTFMGGRVADDAAQDDNTVAMRALNARLVRDTRVRISVLPVADGLTLAMKRA